MEGRGLGPDSVVIEEDLTTSSKPYRKDRGENGGLSEKRGVVGPQKFLHFRVV